MTKEKIVEKAKSIGIDYKQYQNEWDEYLETTDSSELEGEEKKRFEFRKLNKARSSRIRKTYEPSDKIKSLLNSFEEEQTWMVLTENWCGDSAQILPHIAQIAEESTNIDLRILYRDQNLEIMDEYLTNGKSRSIPKLVAFDSSNNQLFEWGPRPQEAQDLVLSEMQNGRTKEEVHKELHLWYAKDKGRSIELEIMECLKNLN